MYEVYHFEKTSDTFFKSGIDKLLKIKQECSGSPTGCVTEEQRNDYICRYEESDG